MVYGQLHGPFAALVDGHGIGTLFIYVAAVIFAGAALHYSVERPFLKLREPVRRIWALRYEKSASARNLAEDSM
jgi:peptidoglycan/LPS O-acetylase OafA/YrhL